eukprot:11193919-Lingulodinium_polyedra.AAC.1
MVTRRKLHEQAAALEELQGAVAAAAAAQDTREAGRDKARHAGTEDGLAANGEVQWVADPGHRGPTLGAGRWSRAVGAADVPEANLQHREDGAEAETGG